MFSSVFFIIFVPKLNKMNSNNDSFWGSIPIVVKNLVILNALLWLATAILPRISGVDLYPVLGLHYIGASDFKAVQLITYMFMHGGFEHLFFNMFSLYIFGRTLEQYWGPRRFLIYYLITGIGAGLTQELVWYLQLEPIVKELNQLMASGIPAGGVDAGSGEIIRSIPQLIAVKTEFLNRFITVGASGSVFGILLAFGMLFPNIHLFLLFFPVPIKAKYFVVLYGLFELFAGVRSFGFGGDSVAHFAHLGGMLFGLILILFWRKKGTLHK